MISAARQMLLAIAALFLSAGHAACACLSLAQDGPTVAQISVSEAGHGLHHGVGDGGDDKPVSPTPCPSACDHCESVALAGDGTLTAASLPALQKSFPIAASPAMVSTPRDHFGALARRLHWAAPPRQSPVSLKIRLRN